MLDTTTNTPASLPQQVAATAYERCQVPCGSRPVWCVVASLPKAERTAHAALHRFGFEAYLPLITVRWRDRTWHTHALWPGYLFVRLDLAKPWHPVKHAPGVFALLSTNGIPSICPDAAVEAIRAGDALRATQAPPTALWAPGMPCRPRAGHPLEGVDAVVMEVGADTARVAILMFGQLREVAVPLDCLTTRDE